MRCLHCRAALLVQIGVSLAGSRFTMHSCPACENRWWERDGELVPLDRILATVSAA
jgi:hypothetical protein